MHNLRFWNNTVELIDRLGITEAVKSDVDIEDALNACSEANRGTFDPSDNFEEYVLVTLVDRISRSLPVRTSV